MNGKVKVSEALRKRMDQVPYGWIPPNLLKQKLPRIFRPCVIIDLHGPLLDWYEAACEIAEQMFGVKIDMEKIRYYNLGFDAECPLTPRQFVDLFTEMAHFTGMSGYGSLPLKPYAKKTIKALKKYRIPYEIWTYVPRATDYNPRTLKVVGTGVPQAKTLELLQENELIDHPRQVRFIRPHERASLMAADHYPLMVDDYPVTAAEVGHYGNGAILTPEPYNKEDINPGVLKLNDLRELAEAIIDFFYQMKKAGALAFQGN
jgi:hypothetical protein